jgi:hypothetical protein
MPHLTQQIAPDGPLVDLLVGVSHPRAQALVRQKQPIPNPVQIRALIDTGASCSCVDAQVLSSLRLMPTGSTPIHTPPTKDTPHSASQYDVSLTLLHPKLHLTFQAVPVLETHLSFQGIQALIGRDVLGNCLFVYDGEAGHFSLAF